MLIKRLNKIIDILNKRNHAAGIGPNIEEIRIIITLKPGLPDGDVKLETVYHDNSVQRAENICPRFWDDVTDNFDLQKYVSGCFDQLNH